MIAALVAAMLSPVALAGELEPLRIPVGRAVILELPSDLVHVDIGDTNVCRLDLLRERMIAVTSTDAGETSLSLDLGGDKPVVYDVIAEVDDPANASHRVDKGRELDIEVVPHIGLFVSTLKVVRIREVGDTLTVRGKKRGATDLWLLHAYGEAPTVLSIYVE